MAEVTKNLGLTKPGENDYLDIGTLNENFDTIDGAVWSIEHGGTGATDGISEVTLKRLNIDSANIDDVFNYNYTMTATTAGQKGTLPIVPSQRYFTIENTYTDRTAKQTATLGLNTTTSTERDTSVYVRERHLSGIWSDWIEVMKKTDEVVIARGSVKSTDNIDTITKTGIYSVTNAANMPTNPYGLLEVYHHGNYITQRYVCNNTTGKKETWERSSSNNGVSWLDWENTHKSYQVDLWCGQNYGRIHSDSNLMALIAHNDTTKDTTNQRRIEICNKNYVSDIQKSLRYCDFVNGVQQTHNLFGEHNKPSGSYTGNGSATARTITIGGIGKTLLVNVGNSISFVSTQGAVMIHLGNKTIQYATQDEVKFVNGVLTIATTNSYVNCNGSKYDYQVL